MTMLGICIGTARTGVGVLTSNELVEWETESFRKEGVDLIPLAKNIGTITVAGRL